MSKLDITLLKLYTADFRRQSRVPFLVILIIPWVKLGYAICIYEFHQLIVLDFSFKIFLVSSFCIFSSFSF